MIDFVIVRVFFRPQFESAYGLFFSAFFWSSSKLEIRPFIEKQTNAQQGEALDMSWVASILAKPWLLSLFQDSGSQRVEIPGGCGDISVKVTVHTVL